MSSPSVATRKPDDTTIIDDFASNAVFKPLLLHPPSTKGEKDHSPSRSRSPFGRRAYHEDQPYPLPHSPLLLPSESKDSLIPSYYLSSSPKSPVLLLDVKSRPSKGKKRTDSAALWLGIYFMLNLTLTLYNKSVLIHFPFPYTLTALHAFCGSIGTTILLHWNRLSHPGALLAAFFTGGRPLSSSNTTSTLPAPLNRREKFVLFLFSILYTVNIVVSNASLKLVTVPFHQVVRGSAPLFTIFLSAVLLGKHSSRAKLVSLIPVVAGLGFATYGDYYFTPWGFFLTLLGTVLAALKTILTNLLQTPFIPSPASSPTTTSFAESLANITRSRRSSTCSGKQLQLPSGPTSSSTLLPTLSLPPLHLLYLLSPLAFMQTTLLAYVTGELDSVWIHLSTPPPSSAEVVNANANARMMAVGVSCSWLLLNGVLAFFLNVVSFNANRRVGPLGMGVASNVKQVLAVLLSVTLFQLTITPTNGLGIGLTLLGGAWYTSVELQERKRRMHLP